ncbi:cyclophane-containing peptide 2OG-Fe(II) oxygenase YhhC [Bradyrhizobium sp. BEA-2-5]|uniref:cyclophane-containing peptide 2OG-Fe(II) oxygenase YhhC n=1 Tax=Bradyrhizobium sp. BEA-2-5 TaxID=3080015 RepID=UPI00293EB6A1|nr:cyclophane-containing peptide 2OG-Fe(II) oxygenase YhhC [Bradyrhizobium sp. BEA-2-5]WOH82137.1 cyclophane-containing peptide 2OG-Fe(II) oxygenase YhhC [Bradyrhizobium sp. BEA-2-5]
MTVSQSHALARQAPFPHAVAGQALDSDLAENVLKWFETTAPWRLRVESFYEQYEMNLHEAELPQEVAPVLSDERVDSLRRQLLNPIEPQELILTEVNAHKLLPGQTIRIHNDYIGGEETHRVLIQLNRDWTDDCGGILMLFSGPTVEEVARLIRPRHASGMAFEISPTSYHAVSTIRSGERYTIVYSFKRAN